MAGKPAAAGAAANHGPGPIHWKIRREEVRILGYVSWRNKFIMSDILIILQRLDQVHGVEISCGICNNRQNSIPGNRNIWYCCFLVIID